MIVEVAGTVKAGTAFATPSLRRSKLASGASRVPDYRERIADAMASFKCEISISFARMRPSFPIKK